MKCLSWSLMNLFQWWQQQSFHDQNENTIVSDDNIENHSSDVMMKRVLKRMKVQVMIDHLKVKHLEITWHHNLILTKTIAFMIKANMKAFISGCILIMLNEDTCVKYVNCIIVISYVHLVGIKVFGPIQM